MRYEAITLSRVVVRAFADLSAARAFVRASRTVVTLRYARSYV